ncbi:HEPN domain-containing protein [Candidatus Gottesmanbacteria bacterium]|nr:HEPN domain-containing protein [Candidatus Gottesmanbacteria bacterium]
MSKLLEEVVEVVPSFSEIVEECEILNSFYIESRYPPEMPDYTKEDILKALHAAEKVRNLFQKVVLGGEEKE